MDRPAIVDGMLDATSPRDRRGRLLMTGWAIALAAALVVGPLASVAAGADPDPTPTETTSPTPTPTPVPTTIAYRLSLLHSGDFTRQYTSYQCVGASLQIMRNIIRSPNNRHRYLQRRLWRIARSHSLYKADGGADPFGWTTATALAGHGRYVLVAAPTMAQAVKAAAEGMAATHRPAGLLVWGGAHAWVLTGIEATANPNQTDDFRVITVRIADPLWPYYHVHNHRIYRPGTRLYMGSLKRHFTRYHDPRRDARIEGKYVAIVPLPDGDPLPQYAWAPKIAPDASPSSPSASPAATPAPTASPGTDGATGTTPETTPTPTSAPTASPTDAATPTPSEQPAPTEQASSGP